MAVPTGCMFHVYSKQVRAAGLSIYQGSTGVGVNRHGVGGFATSAACWCGMGVDTAHDHNHMMLSAINPVVSCPYPQCFYLQRSTMANSSS